MYCGGFRLRADRSANKRPQRQLTSTPRQGEPTGAVLRRYKQADDDDDAHKKRYKDGPDESGYELALRRHPSKNKDEREAGRDRVENCTSLAVACGLITIAAAVPSRITTTDTMAGAQASLNSFRRAARAIRTRRPPRRASSCVEIQPPRWSRIWLPRVRRRPLQRRQRQSASPARTKPSPSARTRRPLQ